MTTSSRHFVQSSDPMTATPAPVVDEIASCSWGCEPSAALSVVVATRDRAGNLAGLLAALEAQQDGDLEVTFVDDGSVDETWATLTELAEHSPLRLLALRLASSRGPSVARNTATARTRGGWLAFTDDDCLPTPGWTRGLREVLTRDVELVQGRTQPEPDSPHGPWDRSIRITVPTPLYETCNLAVSRAAFLRCGGFPVLDLVPGAGARGFGEDAVFGARMIATGGRRAFANQAVVHHRWVPGRYADHLAGLRRLAAFPVLGRQVPELRAAYWHRLFLSGRTAAFDTALTGVVATLLSRRRWPILLVLPWLRLSWRAAADRPGRSTVLRLAQLAVGDLVGLAALLRGSIRARRLLL